MSIEAYTDGKRTLFRERKRAKTALPADAPRPYARALLGPKTLAWIKARGWLAGPRVERKETA